ncbi:hypothetical protein OHE20_09895, partial [Enterococcus faecium]|nr:hypothetical protein [Enterococcus faecium]
MEIKKVYFSQKMSLYSPIQQAKQPLPFFQSHQESRDAFWRSAKKQCAFKAVSKKYTVYFTIAKSRGNVIFNRIRQKSPILYRWVMNAVRYEGYR